MRGINGVNDGQQIYSYDATFSDSTSDDVKGLFTYQVPLLDPGVVMTEALAETMPQSFIYRRLGNGSCAIVLNTYLGRDYMGSAGRFGNHLSHAIICDENELTNYPCEFYGSELLRSRMEFSEVNCPDRPPYLPEPVLNKGYRIDVDSVIEFLSIDDRLDIFKKMLSAMLAFESARKRLVICDDRENIVMWIAALQYALPLKSALNVNFSTYEHDPALSASQICGVIPSGSRYSVSNATAHFTFDFVHNIVPEIEADGEFFDFIDVGMSLSYDSLQAFHGFVSDRLDYTKADDQYYNAYSLYCLFSDGLKNLSLESFKKAVQVSNDIAPNSEKTALVKKLLDEKELILSLTETYALEIIRVLLANMNRLTITSQEQIKQLIVEKVIAAFTSSTIRENNFNKFYKEIEQLSNESQISIPYELMKDANRDNLLSSIKNDNTAWKWEFIVDVLCDFITFRQIPVDQLSIDYPIGRFMGGIIMSVFSIDANRGFSLLTKIINKFVDKWNYLANMVLNIESVLYEVQNSERIIAALWQYFYQTVAKKQFDNRQNIFSFLFSYDRGEQVFGIYSELLTMAHGTKEAKTLFNEQIQSINTKYNQTFNTKIFDLYYGYLMSNKDADTNPALHELMHTVIRRGIAPSFIDELIEKIIAEIPLSEPTKENEKLMNVVLDYYVKQRRQPLPGHLLLVVSGGVLSEIKTKHDLDEAIRQLKKLNDRIDLSVSDRKTEKYLDWTIPSIFAACESSNDLITCYNLFNMSRASSDYFVILCAKEALKESKGDKEFHSIVAFLDFAFNIGSVDKNEIGKIFCKLSKQKLEDLDLAVKTEFHGKRAYLLQWEYIREIANSTNPLLNTFGNLFRRKSDE